MRKKSLFLVSFILTAFALLSGCSENDEPQVTPTPPPAVEEPEVSLTAGEAMLDAVSFTLTSQHAEEVKWFCYDEGQTAPDASTILSSGTAVEPNQTLTVEVKELSPATTYVIVAIATAGEMQTLSNRVEMTTLEPEPQPEPTVALESVAVGETTVSFRLTSSNAEEVKWIYIEKGSRDLKPEQVLQYGTEAEANTSVEITAEGLVDDTEYEFHAVAKSGEVTVMADPLILKTEKYIPPIQTYTLQIDAASASIIKSKSYTNFYLTLTDTAQEYTLVVDLYAAPDSYYFPSGDYTFGSMTAGSLLQNYTSFREGEEGTPRYFTEGMISVEALPNEEALTVEYAIEGNFVFENGDLLNVIYEGQIEGIELPDTGGAPEGYTVFVADPDTSAPKRVQRNDEVSGQYTLKFTDKNWGELTLDFKLDPTTCNDGKDPLPAGTYSIAAGTMTSYSNVLLYSPYVSAYFSTCEAEVSREGEVYTIVVAGSDKSTKIWMNFTGEIKDMARE